MSSVQKTKSEVEDDDNCSEFSVISVYDDQFQDDEECDSTHGSQQLSNGARITYRDPSVHESEGFPDNVSSVSRPTETKNDENKMLTSFPDLASPSTPWNPLALSGYVSTNSVSELMDKVLNEYTRNHELLASINSSILELKKTGKSDGNESESSSSAVSQQKLEKLYDQLTKANQKIVELEKEKQSTEQQFKAAAKDAELYILRLESQLSDQCQQNKKLREELDEREDELRATRSDLYTQRSIAKALEQENAQNEEQIREEYNEKLRLMEKMYKKIHERNEVKSSAGTQTRSPNSSTQATQHPSSNASSISRISSTFAKQNYGLNCPLCQCDCPSADYYNYHMGTHANFFQCQQCNFNFDTKEDLKKHQVEVHEPKTSDFHAELTTRLANTLQTKEVPVIPTAPVFEEKVKSEDVADLISFVEPADENGCASPVSEFSASFVLDSPAQSLDVSDAEEALSTGFRTPAEPEEEILVVEERQVPSSVSGWSAEPEEMEESDLLKLEQVGHCCKDNESQLSGWSSHATSNQTDAVSVDDSLSILDAPTDCASSVVSVSMSSVHSSQIGASASQLGTVSQAEACESQAEEQFVTPSQSGIVENQLLRQVEFDGDQSHVLEAKIQNAKGNQTSIIRKIKTILERNGYTVDDIAVANDEATKTVGSFYKSTASLQSVEPEMKEIAYLKSYFPNLDQKTLPHRWNSADKSKFLDLSVDCLRVQYTSFEWNDAGMIRSDRPIPHDCKFYYFEMTIVDEGNTGYIGIGLCTEDVQLCRLPGWDDGALGYHGDDGNFFASTGVGRSYGPRYSTGDTIGCGINFERRSIFFTKNGQYLGVAKIDINVDKLLYPTVGLQSKNAVVKTNFGQREFSFNVEKNLQLFSNKPRVPVPARPLPFSQQPDQCQIFLCDCLCAFPSKGALVAHKASCSG